MRVSFDSRALTDWRIKRLAKLLGRSHREVLGTLLFVWNACYERRSEYVDASTIDGIAEIDGFCDAMGACELATPPDPQEAGEGLWRICGVADRIAWLDKQRVKGEKGGREAGRRKRRDNALARATAAALAGVQPEGQPLSNPDQIQISDLNQRACGQSAPDARVDQAIGELQAARARLAIALKAGHVQRLSPMARSELLAAIEDADAGPDEITQAVSRLEQIAQIRRRVSDANADMLCQLIRVGGRAPAKRAPLEVVRHEPIAEGGTS